MNKNLVILAAGGTGGHLYPAEALAQELLNRHYPVMIVTDKRGSAFQKLGDRVTIHCVRAGTFKAGIVAKLKAIFNISLGITQAIILLRREKPTLVIGFGGYPSFPTVYAAQLLGIKTMIHEQNGILGKANLWLADKADTIATSLPDTQGIKVTSLAKVKVTGNPVRAAIVAIRDIPYPQIANHLNILITGGSQGALIFSRVIPDAIALLPKAIRERLVIVQQSREDNTGDKYKAIGVTAEVKAFFDDMPLRLAECHLFIGRSGASTVAEIAVVGRPALFIPLLHADRQQYLNAETLTRQDGAWLMDQKDFTPENLARQLEHLAENPVILENAASAARACGRPDAVQKLADLVAERIHA